MENRKFASMLFVFLAYTVVMVSAQTNSEREMTVEESYLEESLEVMVIKEQSRSESRDMKFVALEYIRDAIEGGRAAEDIFKSLEYLALEGAVNKSREGGIGPVVNNYPDVRAKAVSFLGELGGENSHDVLIRVLKAETEPAVITEAVKALAAIDIDDDEDEALTTIAWVVDSFNTLKPDNAVAVSALFAFDKIAGDNGGFKNSKAIQTIISIADGPYIREVKTQASKLLDKLRRQSATAQKSNK